MKKILFLFFIAVVLNCKSIESQIVQNQSFPGKKSTWKGFTRYDFDFRGRSCRIVCPEKPATGKPWIWNARFPDWHIEIDSILLSEGFHVTYINTDEFNGSREGVKVWDEYFRYLTENFGFDNRVALEGISRGGLYVYNFAKKYPYRVSCIYAEAPVCDFKSWPGGFGKGIASKEDWELILKSYGFISNEEALAYSDNPVDNLEKLAEARVPVLHMIGLNDSVVPPAENTFILIDRYVRCGGPATIIPCTFGKQELHGHHFDIETPRIVADFIKGNTRAFRTTLNSSNYHLYRGSLDNSFRRFKDGKSGRVAFLGGSITYNPGWRDSISSMLQKMFPGTDFEFINAGIPSLGSIPDAFRLQQDVLTKGKIDLLFVEAAVNDRTNAYPGKDQVRAMEGIVRHARTANPETDIIFMYFVDPDKMRDYDDGIVPQEIVNHERVAAHYNIPAINLAWEVTERIYNKEFTWESDFKNLHPSPFGQKVYYKSISRLLEEYYDQGRSRVAKTEDTLPSPLDPFSYDSGELISVSKKDANEGWIFEASWVPGDKASTRPGYVNSPMLVCTLPGRILHYRFKGTAVGLAVVSGPDAGIIEYSIDGSAWRKIDLFTEWSNNLHLPWFLTLADELGNKSHNLRVRLIDDNANHQDIKRACRIRYFYVNR